MSAAVQTVSASVVESKEGGEKKHVTEAEALKIFYCGAEDNITPRTLNHYELLMLTTHCLELARQISPDSILLAPGRSPSWHAKILMKMSKQADFCYPFAFSGAPYIKQIPTAKQIEGFRAYLSRLKLTPDVLDKAKNICFLDYIETGNSIQSLLMFFAHWKYDLAQGKVSSAEEWMKLYANDAKKSCYESYRNKVSQLFSISLNQKEINPLLVKIPFVKISSNFTFAANIYNNRFANWLPSFGCHFWELTESDLQFVLKNPPSQAKLSEQRLYPMVDLVQSIVQLVDQIYEEGVGFDLLDYVEDIIPVSYDDSDKMTEKQFLNSFAPQFVAKLIEGYPDYFQNKAKIGENEEYKSIADYLTVLLYESFNLKQTYTVDLNLVRKHLGEHPNIKPIYEVLSGIALQISKPWSVEENSSKTFTPQLDGQQDTKDPKQEQTTVSVTRTTPSAKTS